MRVFYLFNLSLYLFNYPPILHLHIDDTVERTIHLIGWICTVQPQPMPPADQLKAASSRYTVAITTSYVVSNKVMLQRGIHVLFLTADRQPLLVHGQCRWTGMPPYLYYGSAVAFLLDVIHTFDDPRAPFPAELSTWIALGLLAFRAFHFAFAF